ncbi:MAG TPA: hypothetical protein V6D03_05630, partial [Candidatus Caenarcaniphilales bacterium]
SCRPHDFGWQEMLHEAASSAPQGNYWDSLYYLDRQQRIDKQDHYYLFYTGAISLNTYSSSRLNIGVAEPSITDLSDSGQPHQRKTLLSRMPHWIVDLMA